MCEVGSNNCMRYSFTNRHKNIRKQSSDSYPRKGNNMKPTTKLRFVERVEKTILQQWWETNNTINLGFGEMPIGETKGEWRDVPIEKEQT